MRLDAASQSRRANHEHVTEGPAAPRGTFTCRPAIGVERLSPFHLEIREARLVAQAVTQGLDILAVRTQSLRRSHLHFAIGRGLL